VKELSELIRFPLMHTVRMTRQEWAELRARRKGAKPIRGSGRRPGFGNWRELRL
jgi:hypothetical protein